ncbi:MAG: deoxyribose-phosphate aldolase [Anaerolineales bacterium]|nr:deoxyribose-phosphate aldolase [Anaerolineales bacterium]
MIPIENIAAVIDNTEVSPLRTEDQMVEFLESSRDSGFGGVCILPIWVRLASNVLKGSSTTIAMVAGLHGETISMQVGAIREGAAMGADGFDVLIALHAVKVGNWDKVREVTGAVVAAAEGLPVKMILETGCLTEDEIKQASQICLEEGAAYIKTSTGMYSGGATIEAVRLMRAVVGDRIGVKASGGIRTYQDVMMMLNAGASRIGTSTGWQILDGAREL